MRDLDRNALDRHITGGRYSLSHISVICRDCGKKTDVVAETEYGATEWNPQECEHCKTEFTGQEQWEDNTPEPNEDPFEVEREGVNE